MMASATRRAEGSGYNAREFSIGKIFKNQLPFIGTSQEPVAFNPERTPSGWRGVECTHSTHCPSPHLTGSHIESAAHVFGDGIGISQVFERNSEYKKSLKAFHVQVSAEKAVVKRIEVVDGISTIVFASNETYMMIHKKFPELPTDDRIVTRQALERAMIDVCGVQVVLIAFQNEEACVSNWPYLTNEATAFLVEKGIMIVGLNIPSIDREIDGGMTSNHKILFANHNRLIMESLSLSDAPSGCVALEINPYNLGSYNDVVTCRPVVKI